MQQIDSDFSFKSFFTPLTTIKAITFIILLGFIVYANMLSNAFVADDLTLIVFNPLVHSLRNIPSLLFQSNANATGGGAYYIPLTTISFTILYTMFGELSFFFHFYQLLLHISSTCILYLFFTYYLTKRLSFFLACIFLIHPINQETVAYIANLQDVLYFLFGIIALYVYKRTGNENISIKKLSCISFLLLLSLLAKITGIIFILVILFDAILKHKKKIIHLVSTLCITVGVYFLMKFNATTVPFQIEPSSLGRADLETRLQTIPAVIAHYITTFFFPKTLVTHQDWVVQYITFTDFYLPLLIDIVFFALLLFTGVWLYKKSQKLFQTYLFFCFWFCIGFLLHIQLIPLDFTVADRWFYFPLVGLLGMIGMILSQIKLNVKIALTLSLIVILLLSLRTMIRNSNWSNGYTLYAHDIQIAPDNPYLQGLLGNELMQQRNYDKAIYYFEKVSQKNPSAWRNWINLGAAYYSLGDTAKAEKYFAKSIEVGKPLMGYERLGKLYLLENKLDEAKKIIEEGLRIYPQDVALLQLLKITEHKRSN